MAIAGKCHDYMSHGRAICWIAAYYLDTVHEQGGCPGELYSDLSTANGTMAGIHSFLGG